MDAAGGVVGGSVGFFSGGTLYGGAADRGVGASPVGMFLGVVPGWMLAVPAGVAQRASSSPATTRG